MRPAGSKAALAAMIALACFGACNGAAGPRSPETVGSLPADLPLPPGFMLSEREDSWMRGEGAGATARLAIEGPHPPAAVQEFFRGHMLLARWKPALEPAEPDSMAYTKNGRSVRIRLARIESGTLAIVELDDGKTEERP